uniref:Bm14149 n=1 Tax=Brugia malayi TaxID=6279 RepID=A0A1I9G0L4_BRUMA|nr:Bm14149 [Brugia malayi]
MNRIDRWMDGWMLAIDCCHPKCHIASNELLFTSTSTICLLKKEKERKASKSLKHELKMEIAESIKPTGCIDVINQFE